MSCLGVHFALSAEEAATLRSLPDDESRLNHLQVVIEEVYFASHREYLAESDKSWDAMHRALSDGRLTWTGGEYPLNHVVLAGESLYSKTDWIISLKSPGQVRDIAAALPAITEADFRRRYFAIDERDYDCALDEGDFQYTWGWFQGVRDLYVKAARTGRCVLFSADQ